MNEFREFYSRGADDRIETFPIIATLTSDKQTRYQVLRSEGVEVVLSLKARELGLTGPGCISYSVARSDLTVAAYVRQNIGKALIEFLQEISQIEVLKIHKLKDGAVSAPKKTANKPVPGTAVLLLKADSETSVEVRVKKFALEDISKMFESFVNHRIDSGIDFTAQGIELFLNSAAEKGIVAKSKIRDREKYLWHVASPPIFEPIPEASGPKNRLSVAPAKSIDAHAAKSQVPPEKDSLLDQIFVDRILARLSKSELKEYSQVNGDTKNHGFHECLTWFAVPGHGQDDKGKDVDLVHDEDFWRQVARFRTWCDKPPTDPDLINQLGASGIEKNEDLITLLSARVGTFPECGQSFLRAVVMNSPETAAIETGKFQSSNKFFSTFAELISIPALQTDDDVLDAWKVFLGSVSTQELAGMSTNDLSRIVWGMHLNGMDSLLDDSKLWNEFKARLSKDWTADPVADAHVDREFNPENAPTVYSEFLRDSVDSLAKFKVRLQLLQEAIGREVKWVTSTRWWAGLGLKTFARVLGEIGTPSLATGSSMRLAVEDGLAEMISSIRTRSDLAIVFQLPSEVISQNGMAILSDVMNSLGESDPMISRIFGTMVSRRVDDARKQISDEVTSEISELARAKSTLESQVAVLSGRIKELGDESTAWKRRAEAFGNAENADATKIKILETAAQLVRISLSVARREISDVDAREGFEARLIDELAEIGVQPIGAIGDEVLFDPERHTSTRGDIEPETRVNIVSPAFTRKSGKNEEVLLKAFVAPIE